MRAVTVLGRLGSRIASGGPDRRRDARGLAYSATVRRLGSWHDRGALPDVLTAIKRCHDRPATYSPAHVSSRSHHAGPNSRVRLRRVATNPDGSNARTILQIPQVRIWRLTGKFLRYHVVAQYISPTPGELVAPGKQVKAAANWSSRLRWVPVRHGQWRVAVVASQVEHVSITIVCGRVSSGNRSLTCRSLALWPMPRTCATTPSCCPRR